MVQVVSDLTTDPVCTVCIANYNGEDMLRDCIDSVLAQDNADTIKIIVHDDASSDGSVALLCETYPQLQVLRSGTNVGFCIANNRMVAQTQSEFVLLLNNDAALLPGALRALIDAARAHARPAIFTLPQYDWQSGELVDRGCLLDPFYNPVPNLNPTRAEVAMAIGACLFLPRALWNELGGLPEWMESIAEDLYLCCAARLRGHAVTALAESGYRHRCGASFSGARDDLNQFVSTFRRRHLSERNKTATLFVCTPTPLMWPLLALHVVALSCEGIILTCIKRDLHIWRDIYAAALRWIWTNRRWLRGLRQQMQKVTTTRFTTYVGAFRVAPYKLMMLCKRGVPEIRT